jgi:hypothetical protein
MKRVRGVKFRIIISNKSSPNVSITKIAKRLISFELANKKIRVYSLREEESPIKG